MSQSYFPPFQIIEHFCKQEGLSVRAVVQRVFDESDVLYTLKTYNAFRKGRLRITQAMSVVLFECIPNSNSSAFWWTYDGLYAAEEIALDRALFAYFDALHSNHAFWHNSQGFTQPVFTDVTRDFRDGRHSTFSDLEPWVRKLMNKHYTARNVLRQKSL